MKLDWKSTNIVCDSVYSLVFSLQSLYFELFIAVGTGQRKVENNIEKE